MHSSQAYDGIFPETYTLINIMMTLPVETATVEISFSHMKRLEIGCLMNWARLVRIAIEGSEPKLVDFDAILSSQTGKSTFYHNVYVYMYLCQELLQFVVGL